MVPINSTNVPIYIFHHNRQSIFHGHTKMSIFVHNAIKKMALPGLACEKPLGFVDCAA